MGKSNDATPNVPPRDLQPKPEDIHRPDGRLLLLTLVRDIFCFIWEESVGGKKKKRYEKSHICLSVIVKTERKPPPDI